MSSAEKPVGALIAAAGSGERLGLGPKALVRVRGLTLLDLCLEGFVGAVDEVVVALPAGVSWRPSDAASRFERFAVVEGGRDRQQSVLTLVRASLSGIVLVHDVARPFVTPDDAARVAIAASEDGAATAVMAVSDSLVEATSGATVDRARLRAVQTPQGFSREVLLEAHESAVRDGFSATDDAALVRRLGLPVRLVEGSRLLGKLTEPGDVVWAEALYDAWRNRLEEQRRRA